MRYVRRPISRWLPWELARWLQVLVTGVVTAYIGAVCAAAATRVQAGQLRLFAVLLACSAAAGGLAYAAATVAFHAAAPVLGDGAGAGTGERAMLWTVLAAGCGLIRLVVNDDGLVLADVKGSAAATRLIPGISGSEALYGSVAELSPGTLSAFAASHATFAILYSLPLVVALQRSLRQAQLAAETRVDGKTGALNDKTRRRQAGKIARATRTRTPIAVGILGINHFKGVNDTCRHWAGDAILSAVAAVTALLRDYGVTGRVGGGQFGFVLPNSPVLEAIAIAERLRETIPQVTGQREGPPGQAPARDIVSIGIAIVTRPSLDLGRYCRLADDALNAAKQNGRDAVWVVHADQAADPKPWPSGAVRARAGA